MSINQDLTPYVVISIIWDEDNISIVFSDMYKHNGSDFEGHYIWHQDHRTNLVITSNVPLKNMKSLNWLELSKENVDILEQFGVDMFEWNLILVNISSIISNDWYLKRMLRRNDFFSSLFKKWDD